MHPSKRQKLSHQESNNVADSLANSFLHYLGREGLGSTKADISASVAESRPSVANTLQKSVHPTPDKVDITQGQSNSRSAFGTSYTTEEDMRLIRLREDNKVDWVTMPFHFEGRTLASLRVRYSKLRPGATRKQRSIQKTQSGGALDAILPQPAITEAGDLPEQIERNLRKHISQLPEQEQTIQESLQSKVATGPTASSVDVNTQGDWQAPSTLGSVLRHRELGFSNARAAKPSLLPDELKHQTLDTLGPRQYYHGTSGDVNHVAWGPNGFVFACGSIAITDALSMQYNQPCNLLLGDVPNNTVHELPEHHFTRPEIQSGVGNINGTASMRESQDPRLFMTVASVAFSPEGDRLYSAGADGAIRIYDTLSFSERADSSSIRASTRQCEVICSQMFKRPAAVDLLSVSYDGLVAAASHESVLGSLNVYHRNGQIFEHAHCPTHPSTTLPLYPTSLKWSPSYSCRHLLLAGFASDTFDEDHVRAGEVCLWDAAAQTRIPVGATFCNVSDVAWNPNVSSASMLFAVASAPSSGNQSISRGVKSAVQCFAPNNGRTKRVVEFDCPALDINDIVYSPYDDNLVAAGATDGKVYIWDKRFADERQDPLHIFAHGATLSVLDHERNIEEADTGVRFLSWGTTSSRLYSGSSDGVVKIWDPYRATAESHVKDAAMFTSAIMSGAFSPDSSQLLIGEDQGRINLLAIDCEGKSARAAKRFRLQAATTPKNKRDDNSFDIAHGMLESGKIELRPMGNLPKRQAVQGRYYDGPFLVPSREETLLAESEMTASLQAQHDAHSQANHTTSQDTDSSLHLPKADNRVRVAQETIERFESRRLDFERLGPQAEDLQRQFQEAQKKFLEVEASLSTPVPPCELDCNFLPTFVDDCKAADNERSKSRIPLALWYPSQTSKVDQSMLSLAELADYGFTEKCTRCFLSLAARPIVGGLAVCETCASKGKNTGICSRCGGSTQSLNASCERCNFACFRCSKPATVSPGGSCITCAPCGLMWEADVLGYKPLNYSHERLDELNGRMGRLQVLNDNDIGSIEIERLASKCEETSLAEEPKSIRRLYKKH
ncbi:WD40 repeat-like protein [Polychaeton citri CBS 116435]|uniref:WD40 repeat-like protein n=1 Tax=Polychaeton citri CBS 116435 TaxID=1314669 RepID=A0A9P4Q5K4_9PEZI|nr:WD40 repeat-like protein [Polychaeton citri CBS 116435]